MHPVTPAGALVGRESEMSLLTGMVKEVSLGRGGCRAHRGRAGHREVRAGPGGGDRRAGRRAARCSGGPGTSWARSCRCCRSWTGCGSASLPRIRGGRRSSGCCAARSAADRGDERAGGAGRAAAGAGDRAVRGAADRAGDRRPAVGGSGQRHAVGTAGQVDPAGAAAAGRDDAAGRSGRTCWRCAGRWATDRASSWTGWPGRRWPTWWRRWRAAGPTTGCCGWRTGRRATRCTSPSWSRRWPAAPA